MRADLAGLNGGEKHMWLVEHHDEIYAYYQLHGKEATMAEFGIRRDTTFDQVINYTPDWKRKEGQKILERLASRVAVAEEAVRQAKHETRELKEQFSLFVPAVSDAITEKFLKPLLSSVIQLPPGMEVREDDDPLSLKGFTKPLNPTVEKNERNESNLYVMKSQRKAGLHNNIVRP